MAQTDDIALEQWKAWLDNGTSPRISTGLATRYSIGMKVRGSHNHGPMITATALLSRMATKAYGDLPKIVEHAIKILETQRVEGHRVKEFGGYTAFHYGAMGAMIYAVKGIYDTLPMNPLKDRVGYLYSLCLSWWADEIACVRALRTPDGQVLALGCRVTPHDKGGVGEWYSHVSAVGAQVIDHLPHDRVLPWIRAVVPSSILPTRDLHKDTNWGWYKPGSVWPSVCYRMVMKAIESGALPIHDIRDVAVTRKPQLAFDLYSVEYSGGAHVYAPYLVGGPLRQWHSKWNRSTGECITVVGEKPDDPSVPAGRGVRKSPVKFDTSIEPFIAKDSPNNPVVHHVNHPGGWPNPGDGVDFSTQVNDRVKGRIVMPWYPIYMNDRGLGMWAVLSGLRKGSGPGGVGSRGVYNELVRMGIVVEG